MLRDASADFDLDREPSSSAKAEKIRLGLINLGYDAGLRP